MDQYDEIVDECRCERQGTNCRVCHGTGTVSYLVKSEMKQPAAAKTDRDVIESVAEQS
jgi:hypothetical protein